MLASVVGFYSLRCCSSMMPRRSDTPMTHIILNCVVLLVLSSALPVLSRILGNLLSLILPELQSYEIVRVNWTGVFIIWPNTNIVQIVALNVEAVSSPFVQVKVNVVILDIHSRSASSIY